jgi:predicted glycosyltransferase involved in capsule biosynthesis
MLLNDLSIIVPLDFSQRPLDILFKAIHLCKAAHPTGCRIIFGHADRGTLVDRLAYKVLSSFSHSRVVCEKISSTAINTSLLRNIAFEKVETKFLLLLDVDIWPDIELFSKYLKLLVSGKSPLYFLPCIYLTKTGSRKLKKKQLDPEDLTKKFFNFSRKDFLHIASPSSITFMYSEDFRSVGGFDQNFEGHGYEDFDFMLRLARYHKLISPTPSFFSNEPSRSPLFASGYRRELGRLCLPTLFNKDFAYHLHHAKPKASKYYEARTKNFEIFKNKHQELASGEEESATLIEDFIKLCSSNNQIISYFSALFENKPGHVDRYDTFKRRLRFLIND